MPSCTFADCDRPEFRDGLCYGHYRQRQRHQELRPLRGYCNERAVLLQRALALANLEEQPVFDEEFDRAENSFFRAVHRYQLYRYRRGG